MRTDFENLLDYVISSGSVAAGRGNGGVLPTPEEKP